MFHYLMEHTLLELPEAKQFYPLSLAYVVHYRNIEVDVCDRRGSLTCQRGIFFQCVLFRRAHASSGFVMNSLHRK